MGPKRRKKLMALMAGIMAALMILPLFAKIFVRSRGRQGKKN